MYKISIAKPLTVSDHLLLFGCTGWPHHGTPGDIIRCAGKDILPDDSHQAHGGSIELVAHARTGVRVMPMSENIRSGSAAWPTMLSTINATVTRGDITFMPELAMSSALARRHQVIGVSVG